MNKNINDVNLEIGPNTRIENGTIVQLEINGHDIELAVNKPDIPASLFTATLSDGETSPTTLAIITDGDVTDFDDFLDSVVNLWAVDSGEYKKVTYTIGTGKITIGTTDYVEFA